MKIVADRLVDLRHCQYTRVKVGLPCKDHEFSDKSEIVEYLGKLGYDEVLPWKDRFYTCRSHTRFPIGHKFHEISVTISN